MYARQIIDQRLAAIVEDDAKNPRLDPMMRFTAERQSVDMCRSIAAFIEDLRDEETGEYRRSLTLEEHAWIRHERTFCTLDFLYFAERHVRINDYTNKLATFTPNLAQRMVLETWGDMEREQLAIMMLQLKARQLGVTTLTELAIGHRVQFYPDVNAVVASADPEKSDKMLRMMELCWEKQPQFLMPKFTRNAAKMKEFGELNSGLSVQHGAQVTGIARGSTPTVVHLSEIASYDNAEDLIEASLLRAIHETPWVFFIMESTAEGLAGYLPKKWKESCEGWPLRQSRFCPIFLPWFVGSDLYPTISWLKKQPIPSGWIVPDLIVSHAERARVYVQANDLLRDHLGSGWSMSREQMWYYHSEYTAAKKGKTLNKFLSEMPADPDEAFQSTNQSAFEPEVISIYRNESGAKAPWGVFGFLGNEAEIPLKFQASNALIDPTRRRIPLVCRWGGSDTPFTCDLVPLKWQGYQDSPVGKVFIWEPPSADYEYGVGCDTAYGVGGDSSVLEVIRKASFDRSPGQVAEFASNYIGAFNLWPMALALSTLYSPNRKQCRAVIECRGTGDIVQLEMRKRGWSNFHPWLHYDQKRIEPAKASKMGWFTNQAMRELMMDMLLTAINDRWLEIVSPYFVTEMTTLSRDEYEQSFRADYGGHDDRIMALGMVLVSLHILELKGWQARRRQGESFQTFSGEVYYPKDGEETPDPVYDVGVQGRDAPTGETKRYLRDMHQIYGPVHGRQFRPGGRVSSWLKKAKVSSRG